MSFLCTSLWKSVLYLGPKMYNILPKWLNKPLYLWQCPIHFYMFMNKFNFILFDMCWKRTFFSCFTFTIIWNRIFEFSWLGLRLRSISTVLSFQLGKHNRTFSHAYIHTRTYGVQGIDSNYKCSKKNLYRNST